MVAYSFLPKKSLWSPLLACGRLFVFRKKSIMVPYCTILNPIFSSDSIKKTLKWTLQVAFLQVWSVIPVWSLIIFYAFWWYGRLLEGGRLFRIGE